MAAIELGLGLLEIGKPWGHVAGPVPSEKESLDLLARAFEVGIRYFDTAASYAVSEERTGRFLRSLTLGELQTVTIATKFGEHWDFARDAPFVDHSFEALRRSLNTSLERLGRIDVLQLHKPSPAVLKSDGLARAWEYAHTLGIERLGTSPSDLESARETILDPRYQLIQVPYNRDNTVFGPLIREAAEKGIAVAVNRPFAMGKMLAEGARNQDAFAFILELGFHGVILMGTKSTVHLQENWNAFGAALATHAAAAKPLA